MGIEHLMKIKLIMIAMVCKKKYINILLTHEGHSVNKVNFARWIGSRKYYL